jgi:hypothetical protein
VIATIVGRNSEAYCAVPVPPDVGIGAIRLTPIAPYGRYRLEAPQC